MTLTDSFLDILNNVKMTGPQRGAATTVVIKRYKTSHQIDFVLDVVEDMNLDMTLPFARNIITELFSRTPDSAVLNDVFATAGRGHGERSRDHNDRVMQIIKEKYDDRAKELDRKCDAEIAEARAKARARRE